MGAPGDPLNDAEDTFNGGFLFGADEQSPKERQALAREELLARLTALMRSGEGCEKVAVLGVTPLDRPDTAGCNWSFALVLDPAGVGADVYGLAYASVILTARERWNLQSPDEPLRPRQSAYGGRKAKAAMNWEHIQSRWSEYQHNAKRRWSRLSAADLQAIAGDRERLVAKIAERHAIAPAQAEEELAAWLGALRDENPFR